MTKRAKEHKVLVRIQMNNKKFIRWGQQFNAKWGFYPCSECVRWRQRRLAKKRESI